MDKPWKRAKHRQSQLQERRLGKKPNSRQQPNSGRGRFRKRDAITYGHFLTEARTTNADSYTIKKKEFQDLTGQAIRQPPGCLPLMAVEISGLRLVVVRETDFDDLNERLMLLEATDG